MIAGSSELACPTCGSPTVRRRRRRDGAQFWGCPRYPECRGTRQLSAIDQTRNRDVPATNQGVAGGSAAATFDAVAATHRANIERQRPRDHRDRRGCHRGWCRPRVRRLGPNWRLVGGLVIVLGILSALVSLFVLPNDVRAWRTGAEGEVRTAGLLEPSRCWFVVLHDRRVPGRRENIDHVVIGPTGVFVVETKNYAGDLRVRDGELYVNGRRRAGVIDRSRRQATAVSSALNDVPVTRIVVVHRADFPLLRARRSMGLDHRGTFVDSAHSRPAVRSRPRRGRSACRPGGEPTPRSVVIASLADMIVTPLSYTRN